MYFKLRLYLMKVTLRTVEFQLTHYKSLIQKLTGAKSELLERLARAKNERKARPLEPPRLTRSKLSL
jgi:hypothetical protein